MAEHDINSTTCWCNPRLQQPCAHCPLHTPSPLCERCGGTGWEWTYDPTMVTVIVHNNVEYA